jgi:hypothetical protein
MSVFKSYLREHLEQLLILEKAVLEKDDEKVMEIVTKLINNTKRGIED